MTADLVFEFTSTAPEMEKAASAALKRLQESALKTATILSGAGKSSAKDLRKMVDEMEGAAGGSVEALSNMASRMEQRANSFRKNATDLKNTALGQAKALRDAAKQLQDAAAQIGAVNLPRKGASATSIKAFTDQFTSAAKQFESAVADVGSATANYIKFDKQFEDRLKKKSTQANTAASQMAASNELISIQKAQGEALAQASKRQKEAVEADLAGFRNMERLRLQAQNSSQNALAKAQGEALAQASKRQKEAIEADLAGFRNMERLRLQAQNSSQNALAKAQGEALAQASKRQKEAVEADLAGFRNMERLRLQAQNTAQAEQLRSREAHYRKMVAAATNTPAGDFQRYNASSGQAGRLVTVNGLANGPTAGEIATSTRQARDRADELARSLRGVTFEANTLHSASRGLASGFNMLWLTWGEMLPLLAGAAISFGSAFSVKMGAQVDHTLQTIRVLSGETQEAIAGLNDQLLQLASTGPVGPLEVAEAMKTLSLAGMSAGDVSVAIRDVMNFAVAGTTDLKQAADVMTSVATAFNVSAEGFNYVGDVIAKTAAVSKASVESVGEAFKTASVIHKQFGVSLEDAGVGIAALANLGIQGTAAGTALRNMYTDLSGRTPKVTKAMNELGLELRDQSGKFKDLVTLTMEFDKGLSRLDGTAQKNALLTILSERGGKPMIELRELVIEEEKVAREFAKRSGQAVVEGFEEGVKNRLQRMRDSIGNSAGFQIMARIELSETPLKQMETAVSALQSSLVSAFSSVKSEASGVALALQDLFRSDSFKSNIESLLQLTLNLAGGLVSLAKFANENAGALATLTAAYVGLRLAVGHSLELMTFYTKAQTLATTGSWAATAAVTAERVAQGPLAVQKAIATSATQADTLATWANTGAKYAAITASKLFAAALPYVGVVLAVATGAWMLYESVVGSSTKKMEDAAESSAHGKMIAKLNEETARLNENTDAMLANMTVEQLRLSRGQGLDGSKLGKHKELISAEENLAKATARRLRAQETADGTDDRVAVTMLLEGQAKDKLAAEQENARLISKSVRDATTRTVDAAKLNAEITKKLQAARQSAAKTGTDKALAEQQRQLAGTAAQNKLDNDLRYDRLDEIAKANKTELDGLRSRLNSEAEALKDFRDANMVQEGEYQSRITSITLEGEKAQRAAAVEGLQAYAAEIGRLLNGLKAMPKSQISDNDKANRVQELNAKLLAKAEEFQSDMAKIDEEANKRERRLATDQYKELDKLRKANETAIANSKDRVQAIRDEQEMADKTLGLGGADLEATQARLKIELEAKKELRKFDLESLDKIQARDRLRADAELATDNETREAKRRLADDFDAQLRILAKGRADFEAQTQTEVAETVAAVYRKEFRQRVETVSNALSDGIVDALLTGGREGGDRLRAILEKQLVSEPFTLVVKALIQPFTTAVAGGVQSLVGSALGLPSGGNSFLSTLSTGGSLLSAGSFLSKAGSTVGGWLGLNTAIGSGISGAAGAGYGLAAGTGTGLGLSAGGTGLGLSAKASTSGYGLATSTGSATTGSSLMGSLSAAAPYAAAALVALNALGVFRKTKQVGTGLSGTIGASSDIDTYANMRKSGTLFSGPKYWKDRTDSAELTNVMNQATGQIIGSTRAMADALGMDASLIAGYTLKIDEAATEFKQDGMTAEQVQAKFAQVLSDQVATYAEGVAGQVGGIQSIQKVGETAQEALSRAYGWWNAEQQAQIAILNAQGKSQEALNRQRELEIALLSDDEKASRRRVFALEDQIAAETEAADLQRRLNEATMTRTELLALERAQINPLNRWLWDKVVAAEAAEAASDSQAADRKVEIDARIAAEKLLTDQVAEATRVYQEGAEQFDTLRQSLLLAGDAAGLLAATTERSFANPNGKYTAGGVQYDAPQWTETTTAAQFNYDYGVMAARLRRDLSDDLSANALRVQDVGPALSKLSVGNMMSKYDPVTGPVYLGIRDAIVQAAGDTSYAVRDAVDGAALVAAQTQVRSEFGASGPGLASVYSAMAQPQVITDNARAYNDAVGKLNGAMRSGAISTEQFGKALEALESVIPNPGSAEDIAAAVQSAQYAIGRAGFDSINYYFGALGGLAAELAAAAAEAVEPIATMSASIGRLNSFATVFGVSAQAAMSLPSASIAGGGLSLEYAAGTIGTSALISQAAAIASSVLTTADAAAAAKRLAETTAFTDTSAVGLRNAGLLLDGIRQNDAASFENAFIRITDSFAKGNLTGDQFTEVFADALTSFQGVDEETQALTRSMETLRDAMGGFADQLLIDSQRTTLTAGQTLAEMQRQYAVAYTSAMTGDAQATSQFQSLGTSLLSKNLYASQADYNDAFGKVVGDAQRLEVFATNTINANANQQNAVVSELREMNSALNNRVESLEKNLTAALAVIARNTAKTSQGIEQINVTGVTTVPA